MKNSIFNSTDHQFPVNYLKNEVREPVKNAAPEVVKSHFSDHANIDISVSLAALKKVFRPSATLIYLRKALRRGATISSLAVHVIIVAVWKWLEPHFLNAVELHDQAVETATGHFDAFYDFMESFIFLDDKLLQPAMLTANTLPEQKRHNRTKNGEKNNTTARQSPPANSDGSQTAEKSGIELNAANNTRSFLAIKRLPKIKLPLKTTNPDLRPLRPCFIYPVERLQLIFSKCIKARFRRNPKHLNPGIKQHFLPVF